MLIYNSVLRGLCVQTFSGLLCVASSISVLNTNQLEAARGIVLDSSLYIVSATPSDTGTYMCNATNSQGWVHATAHLYVIGKIVFCF